MSDLISIWENAQDHIRETIGTSSYMTWFGHLRQRAQEPDEIIIITPDEFFRNWIADHYLETILEALRKNAGEKIKVRLEVARTPEPSTPSIPIKMSAESLSRPAVKDMTFRARFTFENFVVGSSNRMAYAASRAVAENPAKAYNPLFIYGQSGLGKTHLMQAIANDIKKHKPNTTCLYLSSEQFTNELINAIQHKSTSAFRNKYRNIDVLLLDDIQFIAGRESTQQEFFHTFNTLHEQHKQIVISSDRPPKEISNLEERLVTRFCWGLNTDIQPPAYETRVAILKKKTELEGVSVPQDVIHFIAEQIKTNIRELEGAVIRVVANSMLLDQPISLDLARTILKDMVKESLKTISIEMIQQSVAEHFHLTITDLKSQKRSRNMALPRQIAMYLVRKLTQHSLPEIGNAFGGKDHTTVLYACKKIEEDINKNVEIKYSIEKLTTELNR